VLWSRKARGRTGQGSLQTMLVVVNLVRGRGERGGAVANTKSNCASTQLRAMGQRHGHIAALGLWRTRVYLVRGVEGRWELGGDNQLAMDAIGSRPFFSIGGRGGDVAVGPVLEADVCEGRVSMVVLHGRGSVGTYLNVARQDGHGPLQTLRAKRPGLPYRPRPSYRWMRASLASGELPRRPSVAAVPEPASPPPRVAVPARSGEQCPCWTLRA
jgi:hypothetical protein